MSVPLAVLVVHSNWVCKVAVARPTRLSCFTFGGASLLGAWMMYDGDPVNASGFNFAWLALYLIVNGKESILGIFKGRITPLGLGVSFIQYRFVWKEFFGAKIARSNNHNN